MMTFVPEGWGFFTRNPREEDYFIYELKGSKWVFNERMPISSYTNLFGLNRYPRAQSVEMAMLLANIKDSSWQSRTINTDKIEIDLSKRLSISDPSPYPALSGIICIIRQEPVPWSWSWNRANLKLPSKYVVLNVTSK